MSDLFNRLEEVMERNFSERGEIGASVSVWQKGEQIASLSRGVKNKTTQEPWGISTLIPFYSATKGLAAATLLQSLERNGLTPQSRVIQVWERFPNTTATFGELLSHQCGLAALDESASIWDYPAVIEAVEQQSPLWNDGHGYHPRTYGFLLDHCVRCLEGESLGKVFAQRIARPLDLELWIGLPESLDHRVGTLYPAKMTSWQNENGFYREFNKEGTLVRRAFSSPRGLQSVQEMNQSRAWREGFPAMGGVGSAEGLARFYQAVIGQIEYFSPELQQWMAEPLIEGPDQVLCTTTKFSCGFQLDPLDAQGNKLRKAYGEDPQAFGHPGAGGSHAFGDPQSGLSFAYVMNQMELSVLPSTKTLELVACLTHEV